MKAVLLEGGFGIDNIRLVERPEPAPRPGQVLVRMKAFSLNYRDLLVVKGQYNPKLKLPLTLLSDGAGEVVAIGDGVVRFRVGDGVAAAFMQGWTDGSLTDAKAKTALGGGGADGVLAEYCVFHEDGLVSTPPHLTYEEAATLPGAAVTAWNALVTSGGVQPGDVILTQGTGGVSLFAVQFATALGARVIITSSSDEKLSRVQNFGAYDTINYKTVEYWGERARELTGEGVDHVVELGGAGTFAQSLKAVRTGGTISLIGVLSGNAGEINPVGILMKSVRVQGVYVGSRAMFEAMNRAIDWLKISPVVDRVFPVAEIQEALRYMENGAHFGKICLSWDRQ